MATMEMSEPVRILLAVVLIGMVLGWDFYKPLFKKKSKK
jgi:hypothetical protein